MTDTLLCPMKFPMMTGGKVTPEDCTCDHEKCAWWVAAYTPDTSYSYPRPYGCALKAHAELVQKGYAR